ncbi:hypothetical protein [Micromonospora sp. DT62]|uniref:hypothetical protein n=1 Tax=Micromonospora sp. DT62 TaxID=3416521 RepID=UPI003CF2CD1D
MATKTIDVTLAAMRNAGDNVVSPHGAISARTVRAVDDEQVFQSELLYWRPRSQQPMHPNGAVHIAPGESLTYNTTKRLTVSHFEREAEGQLNQMLIFASDLTQDVVLLGQVHPDERYQGSFNRKLRFDEIDGLNVVSCDYNVVFGGGFWAKIIVTYVVNLVSSSG